jgi:hypothetical protein
VLLPVGVNISPRHLQRPDFVDRIKRVLAEYSDLPPSCLEIEIVETSALGNMDATRTVIEDCVQLGISFALDDFGTGYSSLVYLRNLPTKSIKIDKSFVRDMHSDPHDLAIVDGVINMGAAFGREVIAEGVETEAQGQLLLQIGCEIAQGYAIARPMPGELFVAWARNFVPFASWQSEEYAHWRREDFSLLAAEVDHRYWFEQVLAALTDTTGKKLPPALNTNACRFGRWYHGEGKERYGHLSTFACIEDLHAEAHTATAQALLQANLNHAFSAEQRKNLEANRDALLAAMFSLRQQVARARKPILKSA